MTAISESGSSPIIVASNSLLSYNTTFISSDLLITWLFVIIYPLFESMITPDPKELLL